MMQLIDVTNVLSLIGLSFDLVGAIYLGIAFFIIGYNHMLSQSQTKWDINDDLFYNLLDQKTKGMTGTMFLIAGFINQSVAALPQEIIYLIERAFPLILIIDSLAVIIAIWIPMKIKKSFKEKFIKNELNRK